MTSTKLEPIKSLFRLGEWDMKITSKPIPSPEAGLFIESINSEGVLTGHIMINGMSYSLDLAILEGTHVSFRPHNFEINGTSNPLLYLFAGVLQTDPLMMEGKVMIPFLGSSNSAKVITAGVDPEEDAGLEGSWIATPKPVPPDPEI